jgi:probable phosphoglycerate mutase
MSDLILRDAAHSSPTTLLFVRHAEVHNPRDVVYGRLPRFGLSARGREQAARVADCLAPYPVAAIYTSPLLRARQTAAVIAARHPAAPLRRSALLLEIGTSWQGTPNKEVPKGTSFYVDRRHDRDEVVEDVLARTRRFVRLLLRRHAGQIVVCVSHADPINVLTLATAGHDVTPKLLQQPLAPARGAVVVFEYRQPGFQPPVLSYFDPQDPEPEKPKDGAPADAAADAAEPGAAAAVDEPGAAASVNGQHASSGRPAAPTSPNAADGTAVDTGPSAPR